MGQGFLSVDLLSPATRVMRLPRVVHQGSRTRPGLTSCEPNEPAYAGDSSRLVVMYHGWSLGIQIPALLGLQLQCATYNRRMLSPATRAS
jgi:hypothetical protein